MNLLHPGDPFPELSVDVVEGDVLDLPSTFAGGFGIVIFNRGSWCPFCNAQLSGFQRAQQDLAELGAQVVSISVDDEPTSRALVEKHGLTFPVGHSADAHKLAELTGAFVNPEPVYLQATGFILDPEGKVITSAYSSGAIGRITAPDAVGLIRYVRSVG